MLKTSQSTILEMFNTWKLYMQIYSFTLIRSLNDLPEATRDSNSMNSFTNQLNSDISHPQNYTFKEMSCTNISY